MKKIEDMEKKQNKIEKSVNSLLELQKKNLIMMKFVEDKIIVFIKFIDRTVGNYMFIDSGAPLSLVSVD